MDARTVGVFERARAGFDVAGVAAGEGGERRAAHFAHDRGAGGQFAFGTGGKSGFDDVRAQFGERMGEAQLLGGGHAAAGRLLAVAQGGVEDRDTRGRFAAVVGIHQAMASSALNS